MEYRLTNIHNLLDTIISDCIPLNSLAVNSGEKIIYAVHIDNSILIAYGLSDSIIVIGDLNLGNINWC